MATSVAVAAPVARRRSRVGPDVGRVFGVVALARAPDRCSRRSQRSYSSSGCSPRPLSGSQRWRRSDANSDSAKRSPAPAARSHAPAAPTSSAARSRRRSWRARRARTLDAGPRAEPLAQNPGRSRRQTPATAAPITAHRSWVVRPDEEAPVKVRSLGPGYDANSILNRYGQPRRGWIVIACLGYSRTGAGG
jgi:hypothetical protein